MSEQYEVGKWYKIRCAIVRRGTVRMHIPIIGEAHKDKQFSVDWMHYHIDGRFIKYDGQLSYGINSKGLTNAIIALKQAPHYQDQFEGIVVRRRKCYRLTTGINPPMHATTYNKWHAEQIGKSCAGKKCPHLGTEMLQYGDKLLCPLHNLIGCSKKERIIDMTIHELLAEINTTNEQQ